MNFRLYRHDSLGSTNDEAKRLAQLGEPEGAVVTAETQTAGRGRAGRAWVTPPGAALAFSLLLRPRVNLVHLTQLSLLGGLAVLEGIQQVAPLPLALKWPNDVLAGSRKVAGVLAESGFHGNVLDYAVLGMGVNVNAGPAPDLALEYPAASLAAELGRPLDREALLAAILDAFARRYPLLGQPALAEAWSAHLAMRGQPVRVLGLLETLEGRLLGVKEDGALLVQLENGGVRTILAGDVHLRAAEA
jgi:BirA family biotin operon repressor/biotin-[acetyl-CoA-carboxylase] ligase